METSMQPGSSASSSTSAIFYYSRGGRRVGLRPLRVADQPAHGRLGRTLAVEGREDASRLSTLVTSAARGAFEMDTLGLQQLFGVRATPQRAAVLPTAFEDEADRRIRVVYKELVLRFKPGTHPDTRRKLLEKFGLAERRRNPFVPEQVIVTQPTVRFAGTELVDAANRIAELDELLFAVPNFVSEFQRQRFSTPRPDQWHLRNTGAQGAKAGEDARALGAWVITRGSPSVAVAILDDGVDILHPCLRGRLVRNPDARNPKDRLGRDFFVPADQPDHYDPSPKRFRYPYDRMDGNDIHGTPCAGVVASDGADRATT
jgi:subtilisin family serine protease